ncbi:hypothetical protein CA13_64540 [Planctomycetes bacterium CA13]|uniref:Uncharacterized protein n=1 Tax=Novipirellula herctigrandis TaxID=2527986 RepID=A0A5C5ZCC8_9BACT|nr:hypothetical protein CA13_64540 [Planctomycetes bacterium CA13]
MAMKLNGNEANLQKKLERIPSEVLSQTTPIVSELAVAMQFQTHHVAKRVQFSIGGKKFRAAKRKVTAESVMLPTLVLPEQL